MDENQTEKEIRTQTGKGRNSNPNWKGIRRRQEKKVRQEFYLFIIRYRKHETILKRLKIE